MDETWIIAILALVTGLASPLGGLIAIIIPPSTLFLSIAVGAAGGILMGTFAFEMIPKALAIIPLVAVVFAVMIGTGLTCGLDLFVNRGRMAGNAAQQNQAVARFHKRHGPFGTQVTVLAAASAIEELIEGFSIGVGGTLAMSTAIVMALAISVDNISEALSIGAPAREEDGEHFRRRTLFWTSAIGVALFGAAMAGLLFLKSLPQTALAFLLAIGAGAMFYLTVTDLVPQAERHQFQQSAAIAASAGFLVALIPARIQ